MTTISLTPSVRLPQAADIATQQAAHAPAPNDAPKPKSPSYFSPVVRIDPQTEIAVWEIRDPQTGKVLVQFPREATIKAYRAQATGQAATATNHAGGPDSVPVTPQK
ncbi:MAG TPA: hypothetical protein VKZ79_08520 [Alphaproteobacteria bacterium]|nr:hypothetical protein [Alphaproteobacteria bacterium]